MGIREVLIYFAIKYKGDWDSINEAIKSLEKVNEEVAIKELNSLKCKTITIIDDDYPNSLKNIYKPPFVLFYYGDIDLINKSKILAIVGSRKATDYGVKVTSSLINDLKDIDVVIISGLALGIDITSHKAALANNLSTIAVLGTGIEQCYPKENFEIYEKIKEKGLILSEHPYKENVSKVSFVNRNRIISGLAKVVLVPDAKEKSGTLVTIHFALNQGKEILTVPHSIFDGTICNELIQDGAKVAICAKDIIDELN